ncbi:hypothetical protein UCDDS831_g09131 [Diplodia seriata]|uniref:CENP-V/GFA domain-containing protein n=1 Tax=Diplodia seriata TaxID=420778 RepID=A0A0G2DSR8_9PEZI|nr:hypothetical protein UCDDS831_g09131 [Diplodia seriata]
MSSSPTTTHTGGCACGNMTYAITTPTGGGPVHSSLCHCTACQRSSGCPHTYSHMIPKASFTNTSPPSSTPPKVYVRTVTDADHAAGGGGANTTTTNSVKNYFCPECGTTCWAHSATGDDAGMMAIRAGTLDDLALNDAWRPRTELFCRSKAAWARGFGVEGARAFEGMVGRDVVEEELGKSKN